MSLDFNLYNLGLDRNPGQFSVNLRMAPFYIQNTL